jgi:hypothetical protein
VGGKLLSIRIAKPGSTIHHLAIGSAIDLTLGFLSEASPRIGGGRIQPFLNLE